MNITHLAREVSGRTPPVGETFSQPRKALLVTQAAVHDNLWSYLTSSVFRCNFHRDIVRMGYIRQFDIQA